MNNEQIIDVCSRIRVCSTFLYLKEYENNYADIGNYSIVFHMSYENCLKRSIEQLKEIDCSERIRNELNNSMENSLYNIKENDIADINEKNDGYYRFFDIDGNYIKGLKLHLNSNKLHIYSLLNNVNYIVYNKRKELNEKNRIRNMLDIGRFRQFIIDPNKCKSITVENLNLL